MSDGRGSCLVGSELTGAPCMVCLRGSSHSTTTGYCPIEVCATKNTLPAMKGRFSINATLTILN